jgi:hypothetical protein
MLRLVRRATGAAELEVPAGPDSLSALLAEHLMLPFTVGRGPNNHLRLHAHSNMLIASRSHAEILRTGGVYAVQDLGSQNGTYVNGELVPRDSQRALAQGDVLSFGGPLRVLREGAVIENPFVYDVHFRQAAPPPQPSRRRRARSDAEGAPPARRARAAREASPDEPLPPQPDSLRELLRLMAEPRARGAAPAQQPASPEEAPPSSEEAVLQEASRACKAREARAEPLAPGALSAEAEVRLRSDLTCSVCLCVMAAPHAAACGHLFCGQCILTWLLQKPCCPVCRAPSGAAHPVQFADALVRDALAGGLPAEERVDLDKRLADWEMFRARRAAAPPPCASASGRHLAVRLPPMVLLRLLQLVGA